MHVFETRVALLLKCFSFLGYRLIEGDDLSIQEPSYEPASVLDLVMSVAAEKCEYFLWLSIGFGAQCNLLSSQQNGGLPELRHVPPARAWDTKH